MSLTFAIPDLHGRDDLLEKAFAAITSRASSGTIVTLGDYIDRGPNAREVIEMLMAGPPPNFRLICLRGNHEQLLLKACAQPHRRELVAKWLKIGGSWTLRSYGHAEGVHADLSYVPSAHLVWLSELGLTFEDEHRVFVHAWIEDGVPLAQQSRHDMQWKLYPENHPGGWRGKHVVHGHDFFDAGPLRFPYRTNLDTRAFRTGRLVVGVFDDDVPGGPVELLEVIGAPRHSALAVATSPS